MPFGGSLMELSTRAYDNPYKYNVKELNSQTGLYYYGARYYDPLRSFWLSVDPLVEITMSPYTYTWNDPVNYADPTGMIGERIGDPGGPNTNKTYDGCIIEEVIIKIKRLSFIQKIGRFLGFGNSPSRNATAGSVPTISQAPDKRMPSTLDAAIQDYIDSKPPPGYGTTVGLNIITKEVVTETLNFANVVRNGFLNKSDYSGLGPRMTKWDGNTMGAEESMNAKFNAITYADGMVLGGVTSAVSSTEGAVAGSIEYTTPTDVFGINASKAKPQPGALDVIGHGLLNQLNSTILQLKILKLE